MYSARDERTPGISAGAPIFRLSLGFHLRFLDRLHAVARRRGRHRCHVIQERLIKVCARLRLSSRQGNPASRHTPLVRDWATRPKTWESEGKHLPHFEIYLEPLEHGSNGSPGLKTYLSEKEGLNQEGQPKRWAAGWQLPCKIQRQALSKLGRRYPQ